MNSKSGSGQKTTSPQKRKRSFFKVITEIILIIYLTIVLFYGNAFLPFSEKFFNRFPLIFPLLLIFLFKAAVFFLNKTKKIEKQGKPSHRKDKVIDSAESKSDEELIQSPEKINRLGSKQVPWIIIIFIIALVIKVAAYRSVTTHTVHVDEVILVNEILRMVATESLDNKRYQKAPLYFYINYFVFRCYYEATFKETYPGIGEVPHYHWYELGRCVNAVTGAFFITACFILGFQLLGYTGAFFTAFIVLISPQRLAVDSLFLVHPIADLFVVLLFIALVSTLGRPRTLKFVILGLLLSLATCSFYLRAIATVPLLVMFVKNFAVYTNPLKKVLILSFTTIAVSIILLLPVLLHFDEFISKIEYEHKRHWKTSVSSAKYYKAANTYKATTTWIRRDGVGLPALILAAVGIIIGLYKKNQIVLLTSSLLITHYLFFGAFYQLYNRYNAYLLPFLAILALYAIFKIVPNARENLKENHRFTSLLVIIIITVCLIPNILNFFPTARNFFRSHNLDLFLEWRSQNLHGTVPVISFIKSLKLEGKGVFLITDKHLKKPNRTGLENFLSRRYKYSVIDNLRLQTYFKGWRLITTFNEKSGLGGNVYVFENPLPLDKLKKDNKFKTVKKPVITYS